MIDVKEELKRYMPVEFDYAYDSDLYAKGGQVLAEAVKTFSQVIKKMNKDQYKYSHQLEEILEILEVLEKKQSSMSVLEQEWEKYKDEIDSLLNAIIGVMDCLEDIYRYSIQAGDDGFKTQMEMQWAKTENVLNKYGVIRIEGAGTPFASSLHIAKAIEKNVGTSHGQIIDVIRSGYIWKGNILRKAEVVVNLTHEEY